MSEIERLPESELCVMQVLWNSKEQLKTGQVVELLEQEKGWTRSTIQVLLSRLEDKKFITCNKQGRLKYYSVVVKESDYRMKETKNFVEHFYQNSYKNLVASLVETKALTEEDFQELADMIRNS